VLVFEHQRAPLILRTLAGCCLDLASNRFLIGTNFPRSTSWREPDGFLLLADYLAKALAGPRRLVALAGP
jgi:hypothetical protein